MSTTTSKRKRSNQVAQEASKCRTPAARVPVEAVIERCLTLPRTLISDFFFTRGHSKIKDPKLRKQVRQWICGLRKDDLRKEIAKLGYEELRRLSSSLPALQNTISQIAPTNPTSKNASPGLVFNSAPQAIAHHQPFLSKPKTLNDNFIDELWDFFEPDEYTRFEFRRIVRNMPAADVEELRQAMVQETGRGADSYQFLDQVEHVLNPEETETITHKARRKRRKKHRPSTVNDQHIPEPITHTELAKDIENDYVEAHTISEETGHLPHHAGMPKTKSPEYDIAGHLSSTSNEVVSDVTFDEDLEARNGPVQGPGAVVTFVERNWSDSSEDSSNSVSSESDDDHISPSPKGERNESASPSVFHRSSDSQELTSDEDDVYTINGENAFEHATSRDERIRAGQLHNKFPVTASHSLHHANQMDSFINAPSADFQEIDEEDHNMSREAASRGSIHLAENGDKTSPEALPNVQPRTRSQANGAPRTPRKQTGTASHHFHPSPTPGKVTGSPPTRGSRGLPSIPFPPLDAPLFGLKQEILAHNPFQMLIAVMFFNQTRGEVAFPIFSKLMELYPSPEKLANSDTSDVVELIRPLGLQNNRAKTILKFAKRWLEAPPQKGRRFRTLHYPFTNAGKGLKAVDIISDEDQTQAAWEIAGFPGCGNYAIDSWRIFCRDVLRGLAKDYNGGAASPGFIPEWQKVVPEDKELRAFLKWMWLREGWNWDPYTGEKEIASGEMLAQIRSGEYTTSDLGFFPTVSPKQTPVKKVSIAAQTPPESDNSHSDLSFEADLADTKSDNLEQSHVLNKPISRERGTNAIGPDAKIGTSSYQVRRLSKSEEVSCDEAQKRDKRRSKVKAPAHSRKIKTDYRSRHFSASSSTSPSEAIKGSSEVKQHMQSSNSLPNGKISPGDGVQWKLSSHAENMILRLASKETVNRNRSGLEPTDLQSVAGINEAHSLGGSEFGDEPEADVLRFAERIFSQHPLP